MLVLLEFLLGGVGFVGISVGVLVFVGLPYVAFAFALILAISLKTAMQ